MSLRTALSRSAAATLSRPCRPSASALVRRAASTQVPPSEQPAASPDTAESPKLKTPEQAPQMTDEERHVTAKLRKHFDGADVAVQDVSGASGVGRSHRPVGCLASLGQCWCSPTDLCAAIRMPRRFDRSRGLS